MINKKMQWFYKYQPKYKDIVLPISFKNTFDRIVKEGNIPNLLFYSKGPGVGKSSLLDGLADVMNFEVYHSNVGGENTIQVLKNNISKFNKKGTIKNGKLIVLEEVGNMNPAYQEALKDFIDTDLKNSCIAMTTNTINTLRPSLQDRFFTYNFDFGSSEMDHMVPLIKEYLVNIMKAENVEYSQKNLDEIVDRKFPVIRSMVNIIQQTYLSTGNFKGDIIYGIEPEDLVEYIKNQEFDELIASIYESNISFSEIYKFIRENVNTPEFIPDVAKRCDLIELLEDSQRYHETPDIELHFLHLFVSMYRMDLF